MYEWKERQSKGNWRFWKTKWKCPPKVASNKKSAFLVRSGWDFNRTELSLIRFERANKIGNFGIFGSFARIKVTFAEICQSPHFLTKHRLKMLLMKPPNRPLGAPPPLVFAAGAFFLAKCFRRVFTKKGPAPLGTLPAFGRHSPRSAGPLLVNTLRKHFARKKAPAAVFRLVWPWCRGRYTSCSVY